jgi:hypothetical protein
MNRRGFLSGLISAIAAPAIVRPGILMPIKPSLVPGWSPIFQHGDLIYEGVIIRKQLQQFALEIQREYIRDNLFTPYSWKASDLPSTSDLQSPS